MIWRNVKQVGTVADTSRLGSDVLRNYVESSPTSTTVGSLTPWLFWKPTVEAFHNRGLCIIGHNSHSDLLAGCGFGALTIVRFTGPRISLPNPNGYPSQQTHVVCIDVSLESGLAEQAG